MRFSSLFSLIALPLALLGCGGGGGGAPATVTSTETFQVRQAWNNYASTSRSQIFTLSGRVSGTDVSGSGTVTEGSLSAATFEGVPAQRKTTVLTGTVTAAGGTTPLNDTTSTFFDSNLLPLGYSGSGEYGVILGSVNIPQTARVNDTAVIYTYNRFTSSSKTSRLGTMEVSVALLPDTATTALLKVISIDKTTGGAVESTTTQTFRMTPSGGLTPISEELVEGSTAITLRY